MNRLTFFTVLLVLLSTTGSSVLAQTNHPVSMEQPCIEDVGPGRPTLKRRQRLPETPPPDEARIEEKPLNKEKCKPQDDAAAALDDQNPIRVEFQGLHAFSNADIVRALSERGIGLPRTQMLGAEDLGKAVAIMKELLESRGYFHALVDTREDNAARTITFLVYEGSRPPLAEVRFEGNRIFPSQELASKLWEYLADYPKMQGGYDPYIFDFSISRLLNFVRSRGYLKATFGQPTKKFDERGLVLTIPVEEGVLYRLGQIKIEGVEAVQPEQVRAMLRLRQGDIASAEMIVKWLFEDLKKMYGQMGYIQFTAEPEPEFKAAHGANEGTVDLKVTIDEGRRFRVGAIEFRGSNLGDEKVLGLLRIKPGDVYNQQLLEESIDDLNNLDQFEWIDKDGDIDFKTNEEEGLVVIVVKVNNRGS